MKSYNFKLSRNVGIKWLSAVRLPLNRSCDADTRKNRYKMIKSLFKGYKLKMMDSAGNVKVYAIKCGNCKTLQAA